MIFSFAPNSTQLCMDSARKQSVNIPKLNSQLAALGRQLSVVRANWAAGIDVLMKQPANGSYTVIIQKIGCREIGR